MWEKLAGYSLASLLTIFIHTTPGGHNRIVHVVSPTETPTPTPTATPTPEPTFTPTPTTTPTPEPTIAVVTDLESLFTTYSNTYHVDANLLKKIAQCESGFNSQAYNGSYEGMFQFAAQTWTSTRTAMGLDTNPDLRKNAEESIKTTAYMIAHGGVNAWANCK